MLITIDGPSGAGKSTVSKVLAKRLSYGYLDTGALYRSVAYQAKKEAVDMDDENALSDFLKNLRICIKNINGMMKVFVGDTDVSDHIRTEDIGLSASKISANAMVRSALLKIQREAGERGSIVAEGRDMGSVVFPDADIKFFLDATVEERIKRRYKELVDKGMAVDFQTVQRDLNLRDRQDRERTVAPLTIPRDAIVIDSSNMNTTDVVENMMNLVNKHMGDEKSL